MAVIDFHSHILPATDHGCADIQESILQLNLISENKTNTVVATPHFYPHMHRVESFIETVNNAVSEIHQADIHFPLNLALGAEVFLCNGLDQMDGLDQLCIRGTKTMLLELPMKPLKQSGYDTVENILSAGYTVVLAHIDRYMKVNPQGIDELISMGAYAQINASSLASHGMRSKLYPYIKDGDTVCAIGSDLHGHDKKQYKPFCKAQKLLGEDFGEIMCRTEKLLFGAEIINLR